jgi:hypothetical protein
MAPSRRIGDVLLAKGLIDESQLEHALALQRKSGKRLGDVLVGEGTISWLELAQALAEQWEDPHASAERTAGEDTRSRTEPSVAELQEMLRDRQRRIIELSSLVRLQRSGRAPARGDPRARSLTPQPVRRLTT